MCARLAATAVHSASIFVFFGKIQKKSRKMMKSLEGGLQKLWMTDERQAFEREFKEKDETEAGRRQMGW